LFDLYTRMIARHFAKHVPGNPTVIVENMTRRKRYHRGELRLQRRQAGWLDDWRMRGAAGLAAHQRVRCGFFHSHD
jgi:hypothetical protein